MSKMATDKTTIQIVLNDMGLGTFFQNFEKERVDPTMIDSMTDTDLSRLGIQTMGDRFYFRKKVKEIVEIGTASPNSSTVNTLAQGTSIPTLSLRSNISQMRNRLFQPYNVTRGKKHHSGATRTRSRTWTANFVCLASTEAEAVPSTQEKEILARAGLGVKKITLYYEDDEEAVVERLISDDGFPRLKLAGGFELLRTTQNCRTLTILSCNYAVKELRSVISSQTKIYIRPVQNNLSTAPENDDGDKCFVIRKEKCQFCDKDFEIRALRAHVEICTPKVEDDSLNAHENVAPSALPRLNLTRITNTTSLETEAHSISSISFSSSVLPDLDFLEDTVITDPPVVHTPSFPSVVGAPSEQTVLDVVNQCIGYCLERNITDPVEILKKLQLDIVTGRPLDVRSVSEVLEGDTNFISVDRDDIISTAFEEISGIGISDLRTTLEVGFYGEVAVDVGGPRKEFFRLVLQDIKVKYFDFGLRELLADDYITVGKIFALSILQKGKIPQFLKTEIVDELISLDNTSICISNLRQGMDSLGLIEVLRKLPTFRHIFSNTPAKLTVKKLVHILKPEFSEQGSNKLKHEKIVYSALTRYLREVAAGRRGNITLHNILEFATSTDEEPLLGFEIEPSITFCECSDSFYPVSNTCINKLTLPRPSNLVGIPDDSALFNIYDLAFSNSFYGLK